MDIPVVDAVLRAFGPFLIPAAVFAAGVVGYGVLFLAERLLDDEGPTGWPTGTTEGSDDPTDTERQEG
jgi:hypothetical protein